MSAVFDDADDDAGLVFDDLIPEDGEGAGRGGAGARGNGEGAGGELTAAEAEKADEELQAAAAAVVRPAKRRRAPFNESHMASARGFALLHEMATDALRGPNPPVRVRTSRGREAEGMAACATLWRAWAQASYPGLSLSDMVPRLASMSGRSGIKAAAAAARERDAKLVEGQRLWRFRASGAGEDGGAAGGSPEPARGGSATAADAAAPTPSRAATAAPPGSSGSAGRAGAPSSGGASEAGPGPGDDVLADAEAAMREAAEGGAGARATVGAGNEEEEDYAALGVDLDEFM